MSEAKSKRIMGLFAVLIMLHHLGQEVSAPWIDASVRQHGLEIFVPIGFLVVAFFFFGSGYGLVKSMRSKEDYFDGFFIRRLNRIFFVFIVTDLLFLVGRIDRDIVAWPANTYSWFVFTIIILYVGFFLTYRKEKKYSFALMCGWVLLYCIICYNLALGNWWINSCPAFLLGILMADKKEKTGRNRIIISASVFLVTFLTSEFSSTIYRSIGLTNYGVLNSAKILLEMISSAAFALLIYYIALNTKETPKEEENKVQKVMSIFGGMTFEFYLVHGLFVQVFGPHFIGKAPYFYIRNVILYVLVVFALSTAAAYGLKKAFEFLKEFHERSAAMKVFCHNLKRTLIILLCLSVVIVIGMGVKHAMDASDAKKKMEEYKNKNISFVTVDGDEIAVYSEGEGKYTLVLTSSAWVPGSTMNLRPLADQLSENYRVVIIDFPGAGFSADTNKEKTNDYFADIMKGVLDAMDIKENIVLVPHALAGVYAYRYLEKYPEGVVALACIDTVVPEIAPHLLSGNFGSTEEYEWNIKRSLQSQWIGKECATLTGFIDFDMMDFEEMFVANIKEYSPAIREMFLEGYLNEAYRKEYLKAYTNLMSMKNYTLPEDLPVVILMSSDVGSSGAYNVNWSSCYTRMFSNSEKQSIVIFSGNTYAVYYSPRLIQQNLDTFIATL
ncbi:MAG: acyltransferase family protein [Clostridiales bacterium]|nr:acyltransferase family protein [Clostridiales bacterium]